MDLEKLKASQAERAGKSFEIEVPEWSETLKVRRATIADQQKAQAWASKNFKKNETVATGAALVCIVTEGLELKKETIDFLLSEPLEIIVPIIEEINRLAGINA